MFTLKTALNAVGFIALMLLALACLHGLADIIEAGQRALLK
jgi:hypothetical protein